MMKKKFGAADAAKEWIELKAKEKEIGKRFIELKPILEEALRNSPDETCEFHGWRFKLTEFEQSSFRLKEAQKKIDGRTLAPYITTSLVCQIRTSWQGGIEQEAA